MRGEQRNRRLLVPVRLFLALAAFRLQLVAQQPGPAAGVLQHSVGSGETIGSKSPARSDASVGTGSSTSAAGKDPAVEEELIASVEVNGKQVTEFAHLLRVGSARYCVTPDVLRSARLPVPDSASRTFHSTEYYCLDALSGISLHFDEQRQALVLAISPGVLPLTTLNGMPHGSYTLTTPSVGMFVNHDVQVGGGGGQGRYYLNGILETGFFSAGGVVTSSFTASDGSVIASRVNRLETQFMREFPDRRAVLAVGDTISSSGPWGRPVHYAGLQWASKFSTQPFFIPFALPQMQGQAAEPSTVDIYVNNVRTMNQPVPAGPFTIDNIPVMTPQGDVRMVITDALGRQQVITRSYLNPRQLLRAHVHEYSYDAGIMRWGLGLPQDSYHTLFLAADHRYGLRDKLTLDFRGEVLGISQTVGFGADAGLSPLGILSGGFALSHGSRGAGALGYAQLQHSVRTWGFGGSVQFASSTFQQLGLFTGELSPRLQAQSSISHALGNHGSVALGYVVLNRYQPLTPSQSGEKNFSGLTGSAGIRLWRWGELGVTVTHSSTIAHGTSVATTLSIPLGSLRNVLISGAVGGGSNYGTAEVSKSLPVGDGVGYRARVESENQWVDAGLYYQNRYGTYSMEASESPNGLAWRLSERGGIAIAGEKWVPTRWLYDSFALVDVPQTKGVHVYANNQLVTTTDSRGLAAIPLVPYDRNALRLDDADLPMDLAMDLAERTVTPMSRTGSLIRFKANVVHGATIVLRYSDGTPLPVGADVEANGAHYEIANGGEVFIENIAYPVLLHIRSAKQGCEVKVTAPPDERPLPRIGPLTCVPQ